MKTHASRRNGTIFGGIIKGVLLSVAATVVLVAIFALLISFFEFSDGLIHTVNQIIKLLAILAGVWVAVQPGSERGLARGAAVGLIYMAAGVMVYAAWTGQHLSAGAYAADILMGVAAGGLFGLWRARMNA